MSPDDPFGLQRFVDAQAGVHETACAELRSGRKTSHWMWFVFPQVQGLGLSAMSRRFALSGLDEARAYLAHPVLGPRLQTATELVLALRGRSAEAIFGGVDAAKFRSSMTLFARAAAGQSPFRTALDRYFAGEEDPLTVARL